MKNKKDEFEHENIEDLAKFPSENPNPVLRVSPEGDILYQNRASKSLLECGLCPEGKPLQASWKDTLRETFDRGDPRELEVTCKDQVYLLSLAPITESNYINIYALDITEKKKANEANEKLRQQNELILNSAGEGIYGLDNKGNTTFVNPAAAKMLGWAPEELLGKPQHAVIHHKKPDGTPYHREDCPIYAAFKDGGVHRVDDEVFWRKDGSCFPIQYISTPIKNEAGKLEGAVVTFFDITERKRAEEALAKAHAEVKQLKDRLAAENIYLQEEIKTQHNFEEIITKSEVFTKVLGKIEQVASTDSTVLILGETGTGKELISRAIHNISRRSDRPLVKVNCAAIPVNLIESELFGHEKGAFTGALSQRIGRFELADGGTIFLDEIGDLPIDLQTKLLRVLQEGEFERLGSSKTIKVDVRVISATNRDLEKAIEEGNFRQDLYYRLNVFPIQCPPLRAREGDIPLLVNHFVKKFSTKLGKKIEKVPQKVLSTLEAYSWPGNVRELENVIERAVIVTSDTTLSIDEGFVPHAKEKSKAQKTNTLGELERNHILKALEACDWVIEGRRGAAARLEIPPSSLRDRMKKHTIQKPSQVE